MSETNLEIGKSVGDYEIIALLGQGGMGKVFKVRNVISDRVDAMKSLLSYGNGESEAAERFIREIKVLAKLEHPNITSFRTAFRANEESPDDHGVRRGEFSLPETWSSPT